jgi:hypothetical protein
VLQHQRKRFQRLHRYLHLLKIRMKFLSNRF